MKQRSFQAEVTNSLILLHSKRGRPSLNATSPPPPPKRVPVEIPNDVRMDQVAHWPVKCDKRSRCKVCKINATTTLCDKCDVRLCFTEERNCYYISLLLSFLQVQYIFVKTSKRQSHLFLFSLKFLCCKTNLKKQFCC